MNAERDEAGEEGSEVDWVGDALSKWAIINSIGKEEISRVTVTADEKRTPQRKWTNIDLYRQLGGVFVRILYIR